ncbi:MAG: diacylglycerol kinase family lipid kinase [Actinomycetia bacterium]|nr:diacylglycerol kinase family lipid kinase [Actinomycetes bacterium]
MLDKQKQTLVILNPASARKTTILAKPEIESCLSKQGIDYHLHVSTSAEDIMNTVNKFRDRYKNFISVGGDGTAHYIANSLAGTDKNLGIIPMGSGNDISSYFNIPHNIEECCRIIKKGNTTRIDLGLINNQYYYMGVAGSGFDSEVTDLANNTRLPFKGPFKYTYAVYNILITFRSREFKLAYNSQQRALHSMMIAVANLPSYGGGMKVAPDTDPTDGKLDVCIIKRMSKIHFIKVFPTVFEGKHIYDPFVEMLQTGNIKIDCPRYRFSVFADGEYICKLPAEFDLVPGALNLIVPPST